MSWEENVEVVRRAFESFNRLDLAGAVAALERDAEWMPYLAALEEDVYRGRDDIERMWREVLRDVPDLRMEFVRGSPIRPRPLCSRSSFAAWVRPVEPTFGPLSFRLSRSATVRSQECRDSAPPRTPSKPWGCGRS